MPKAPTRILIAAALCAVSLIGLVVRESMARANGTEVLLAMEAVDPRALLSGHYVIVALQEALGADEVCPVELSQQPEFWLTPNDQPPPISEWVSLAPANSHHRAIAMSDTRQAALARSPLAVRGRAFCFPGGEVRAPVAGANIRLDVGIDRFHINQTDAERIDALLRAQTPGAEARIFAIVSIGQDGRARLKGLMVDGERLELNWL